MSMKVEMWRKTEKMEKEKKKSKNFWKETLCFYYLFIF